MRMRSEGLEPLLNDQGELTILDKPPSALLD